MANPKATARKHRRTGRPKGHWLKGKRRNNCPDAAEFVARVASARRISRLLDVSDRTVKRWAKGMDCPPLSKMKELVELLFPQSAGSLPSYETSMALDGNTRVGGVGEYSVRSARGGHETLCLLPNISWEEMQRIEDNHE